MKKLCTILILMIIFLFPLSSVGYVNDGFGYSLDLPEGWGILDQSNPAMVSFTDPDGNAVLQIYVFTAESFNTSEDIYKHIKNSLYATGEAEGFEFCGYDSVFADLTFSGKSFMARGYYAFINAEEYDFAIMSFTALDHYEKYHDFMLSAIDSFSINKYDKLKPGPVSQYFYPYPAKNKEPNIININGKKINISFDKMELDATQVLVNRESRILAAYKDKENRIQAWLRYYKMIYRDNYERMEAISNQLAKELNFQNMTEKDVVTSLLAWLQNYQYYREGSVKETDLISPLLSFASSKGDCDTRALLFNIILHQIGIDSILLVSEEYSHSATGVFVNSKGAKFNYNGKDYIYAELTANVELGLIDKNMSNLDGWIVMPLKDNSMF